MECEWYENFPDDRDVNNRDVWNECLSSMELGSEHEIELRPVIENFLIPDNINAIKFNGNWQFLEDSHSAETVTTKSVKRFQSIVKRPMGYPIWFFAGYPDVATWFTDLCDVELDSDAEKAHELVFGTYNESTFEKDFVDSESRCIKDKHLRTLINHYLTNVKSKLECAG